MPNQTCKQLYFFWLSWYHVSCHFVVADLRHMFSYLVILTKTLHHNGPSIVAIHRSVVQNDTRNQKQRPFKMEDLLSTIRTQDTVQLFYWSGFESGQPFVYVVLPGIMGSPVREGQNVIPHQKEVKCNEMWLVILTLILEAWRNVFCFLVHFRWHRSWKPGCCTPEKNGVSPSPLSPLKWCCPDSPASPFYHWGILGPCTIALITVSLQSHVSRGKLVGITATFKNNG